MPGPYVKWFLSAVGADGLYRMLHGFQDKTGYAVSLFGYQSRLDEEPIIFEGRTNGIIVKPRGKRDFGWEPCFQVIKT